ncbi:glycerate kinase [Streptomyces antimycoticus]|uniref:glycerate kinase n=1 Tax=Streptomyces antimycoticus TaxID=68175 RepID=UPI0025712E74|nr:glycerate kinase [Streptomyces antimycoticus]WJE00881.1 glycerate kinase [Streptomyces antimycoticus]
MQVDAVRRVVLAPDKFKGTVSAQRLVEVMAAVIAEQAPAAAVSRLPVADGGDGSVAAALSAGWRAVSVPASDSWGAHVQAPVARLGGRAIVEVASVCGLGARRPDPSEAATATTYGVGQVVAALLDDGVEEITLALGGTAATDGGTGLLCALGAELHDAQANRLVPGGAALLELATVRTTGLHPGLRNARLVLACDVDTPMVGSDGSAEMFARQKGADDDMIRRLSAGLAHAADILESAFGNRGAARRPGSGAAGGLAWAGLLLGGYLRSGAEVFLDLLGAGNEIRGADLVITGEGCLDPQSLRGKAPVSIARLARTFGVKTVAIVGSDRLPAAADKGTLFADTIALDRIDPACANDPELTCRLVGQATRALIQTHLGLRTAHSNGART